jgi:hypothetical protein
MTEISSETTYETTRPMLCNDPHGLALANEQVVIVDLKSSTTPTTPTRLEDTGVYTNLVRLAAQLSPAKQQQQNPLITLEMEHSVAILVKEYDEGHAVAMRVPTTPRLGGSNGSAAAATTSLGNT